MPKNKIKVQNKIVSDKGIQSALELMSKEKLVFILNNANDRKRLMKFVQEKNKRLYNKEKFTLSSLSHNEPYLFIAATPSSDA